MISLVGSSLYKDLAKARSSNLYFLLKGRSDLRRNLDWWMKDIRVLRYSGVGFEARGCSFAVGSR
jgi:hypothetical protein